MDIEIVDFAKEVVKVLDNQKAFFKNSSTMMGADKKRAVEHAKAMEAALYKQAKEIIAADQPQQSNIF